MIPRTRRSVTLLAAGVLGGACFAPAAGAQSISIETVVVGNPGNPGEQSRLASSDPTFYGAVAYTFRIGKFEVTAGQYTGFLNAVAATDTHNLYNTRMDYDADPSREGCNIKRHGDPGSYTYSVAPDWANRPVNYVSWGDAARFANWLHNGQPTGPQDLSTTEDGSYFLNGMNSDSQLEAVVREPDASWVIPTDDEWYKAAYHKNDGATGNYWNFGTGSDFFPDNDLIDPDPGNHATYHVGVFGDPNGFTIGPPYNRTEAGAHENSASSYGSFDQAGNMMEFTETVPESDIRRMRDGSWKLDSGLMGASQIDDVMHSSDQFSTLGFRLALVHGTDVINLRGFDSAATYFEWDPMTGGGGNVYDLVRGDLANLSGNASEVDLGSLLCIESSSLDESSDGNPDTDMPAPGTAYFYLVRFKDGSVIGPWGFGSEGGERVGAGGCAP